MQSSPYHSNKLFDNRFSMMNIPKSSSECPWKLVKEVDSKTGAFIYKLVNSEHESNISKITNEVDRKLKTTTQNTVRNTKSKVEQLPTEEKVEQLPTEEKVEQLPTDEKVEPKLGETLTDKQDGIFLRTLNGETTVVEKKIIHNQNEKGINVFDSKRTTNKENQSTVASLNETTVEELKKIIDEKNQLLSESLLKKVPSQDLLFENYASFELDFSTFRSKSKNFMLTHFPPYVKPCYSKDIQSISKNSRIIDFRSDHLVKVDQAIIMINGESVYLQENLELSLSFKFICSNGLKHRIYEHTTSRIKLRNKDGNLSERILTNINSFLPQSDQNIYTYIPILQVHKNNTEGEFDLTAKVVLRTSQVAVNSLSNLDELSYLSKDQIFIEK